MYSIPTTTLRRFLPLHHLFPAASASASASATGASRSAPALPSRARAVRAAAPRTSATLPVTRSRARESHPVRTQPIYQARHYSMTSDAQLRFKNPAVLVCDVQEKFQTAIHEFDKIILTSQKLLTFANTFSVPVHATTQTSAKLGPTVPSLAALLPTPPLDKTKFSMYSPELAAALPPASEVALLGIEAHICITQTALDLRDAGHRVYVIADGVSSCNPAEVVVALDRLRAEGGITVTSSESWMYECVGDAAHPGFKGLIGIVKGAMADTKSVLLSLPPRI